jgi:hypothetical protein
VTGLSISTALSSLTAQEVHYYLLLSSGSKEIGFWGCEKERRLKAAAAASNRPETADIFPRQQIVQIFQHIVNLHHSLTHGPYCNSNFHLKMFESAAATKQ